MQGGRNLLRSFRGAGICMGTALAIWAAAPIPLSAKKAGEDRQRTVQGETLPRQSVPPTEDIYRAQVLLGTTLGIFWHEFGHALIGETGLPATGPEEDVADGFSAFVLSAAVEESGIAAEEQAFMAQVVKYSALLWYYVAEQREKSGQKQPWQDEHAPDMKRFRNSFCIIYGSNPARHEAIAQQVGLSERTRARCETEYAKRYRAWETILKTVSRDLGPNAEGVYPASAPGGRILLSFEAPGSVTGKTVVRLLNDTGIMTHMMAEMERLFVWPRDLSVVFRDCDLPNAWYDPKAGSVTLCYSLIEQLSGLIFRSEGRAWNG
ncbi:MAG: DUF4344 domain-containing metallopeptidase [Paracoccaceae bacterium]